jgi:sec-independent protein translocase protein TatA
MSTLGLPELLIIAVIALLLFGVGRIGKLGSELGSGIRAFKDAITQEAHDDRQD